MIVAIVVAPIAAVTLVGSSNWSIGTTVLLSAQPVLAPLVVNGAVVDPQSHSKVAWPWTDKDGKNVKQPVGFEW